MDQEKQTRQTGFTLLELLIAVTVIAILAAIGYVSYGGAREKAREGVLRSDLTTAAELLGIDKARTGFYPEDMSETDKSNGLPASDGTTYQYTVDNFSNPPIFCLTGINGRLALFVTEEGIVQQGACEGHTGPSVGGSDNDNDDDDGDDGSGGSTLTCDSGFIPVPGNGLFGTDDFCVAKYEAKNVDGVATSQAADEPWSRITQLAAITAADSACDDCHLITENEWLTIAHNVVNVDSNWSGGSVGDGYIYSGHNDNSPASALSASADDNDGYYDTGNSSGNQRRTLTLSNGEVIWDFAGNVWEWTSGQTSGSTKPGGAGNGWREWSAVEGTGSLSPSPFPSYGTPAASGWTSANGIGKLYSNTSDTNLRGFLRGGNRNYGSSVGVFSLMLYIAPNGTDSTVGFRVAK